jgi:hypothetical protein
MKRVATFADGWTPVMWPTDQLGSAMDGIKTMAREAGRNSDDLKLVVRGNVRLTPEPLEERGSFVGSWDQILTDIKETEVAGADELLIEPQGDSPEEFISLMERVRAAIGQRSPEPRHLRVPIGELPAHNSVVLGRNRRFGLRKAAVRAGHAGAPSARRFVPAGRCSHSVPGCH